MRWRKPILICAAVIAGLLISAAAAFAFLVATEPGLRLAAAAVNRIGAGSIAVEGVSGRLSDTVAAERLSISDDAGVWLRIDNARLDWSPLALLQRRLEIDSLSADRLVVDRRPAKTAADAGQDRGRILPLPVDIVLRKLDLPAIRLREPVAGVPADLAAAGNLTVPRSGRDMDVALTVRRTDQPATADLRLRHDATSGLFDVQVDASAPAGGVIVRLLEVPGLPPLSLSLSGRGRVDDLSVDLLASAGDDVSVTASAALRGTPEDLALDISGEAKLAPMAPEAVRPLVGEPVSFAATARLVDGTESKIDNARVSAGTLAATVAGTVDLAARQTALTLEAEGDVAPLAEIAGETGSGRFELEATAAGSLDSPTVDYRLAVDNPAIAEAAAERVTAVGKAVLNRSGAALATDVKGDLIADGLVVNGAAPPVAGGDVTAEYDMTVDTGSGAVAIRALDASAGPANATVSGTVAADGRVDLAVRGELADLASLGLQGPTLGGRATVDGTIVSADEGGHAISATLGTADLSVGDPAVAALLGTAPTLTLAGTVGADRTIEADRIALQGAAMTAAGSGRIGEDMSRVDAVFDVRVPNLKPLADALGIGVDGGAAAALQASGSLTAPDVSVNLTWADLTVDRVASPKGSAWLDLKALDTEPRGPASIEATVNGLDLTARADLTVGDDIRIDGLEVIGPEMNLTGDLIVDLESGLIAGAVRGDAADIAPYAALADQNAGGRLTVDATFSHGDGTQAVDARLDGEDLLLDDAGLSVASARVDAQLADLFGAPGVTARATLERITSGDTVIDDLDLRASLAGDIVDFELQANGPSDYGVALQAAGTTSIGGDTIDLSLRRLDGTVAAETIALRAPARLRFGPGALSVEGLDLAVGEGDLRGTARITDTALTGDLEAVGLPLAMAAPFLGEETPTGFVDAAVELGGLPEEPVATARIAVRDLRMSAVAPSDELPPFGAVIQADWRGGRA
ncbi:MAG: hypothetical protein MI806_05935, partial [Minwuiales bacterium]|nr:hypothetical protein [Minwuiales bacterium]